MSIFNEKQVEAMFSRNYICNKCGGKMKFEDEWEDILICPQCGHDIDLEHYGFENDEEYEAQYPTKENVIEYEEEDDSGESYDEVCGELDDYA